MKTRDKLILVLVVGLLLRLLVMPHTQHPATGVKVDLMDELFLEGFLPILRTSGFGTSFYLFYAPMYLLYGLFQSLGLGHNFVLYAFFKIPPLVGNLIIFYSLYEILRIETGSKDTALKVSAFYFLNPYVIFIEAWVGHAEQLSVSFILLSFLFLIKGQSGRSGVFYALSIFTRYIPILLLPLFISYIWLNRGVKNLSLYRFITYFVLTGMLLSIPYVFIVYEAYRYSPQIFVSYFSHFFEGSTLQSAYTLPDLADFMYNFTGFFYSIGLWEKVKFLYGAKAFIPAYLTAGTVLLFWAIKNKKRISTRELITFPIFLYALFLILMPLQQHHYLSWLLPFLFLATGLSMMPGYFITALWIGNLLIDPVTGGGYKYAFGNTFGDPFREKMAHFVNFPIQQAMSVLMGLILIFIMYLCLKSVINSNLIIKSRIAGVNKPKVLFFAVLLTIFSITEMIRMVYHPMLYTYGYSILFGVFVLVEFFGLRNGEGPALLEFNRKNLPHLLGLSSIFLILAIVSFYLWDLSYLPFFVVLSIANLHTWKSDSGPGGLLSVFLMTEIFLFVAITYLVVLVPNYLTLALYAIFLTTWVARQLGSEMMIMERMKPPGEELYTPPQKQQQEM